MGAKPAVITAVGKDELGKILLARAEEMKIDTSYILIDEKKPTGTVNVELKDEGIPIFTINEGVAWDAITPDEKTFKALLRGEMGRFLFWNACSEVGRKQENSEKVTFGNKGKTFFLRRKPESRFLHKGMDIIFTRTLPRFSR